MVAVIIGLVARAYREQEWRVKDHTSMSLNSKMIYFHTFYGVFLLDK